MDVMKAEVLAFLIKVVYPIYTHSHTVVHVLTSDCYSVQPRAEM